MSCSSIAFNPLILLIAFENSSSIYDSYCIILGAAGTSLRYTEAMDGWGIFNIFLEILSQKVAIIGMHVNCRMHGKLQHGLIVYEI